MDLQCNGYQGSGSAPAPLSATVAAGSTISLHWTTWPDSHHGPVITYLAKCPSSCTNYSPGNAAVWFKVAEAGKASDGTWASDAFITNQAYTFKVPSSLAAGNYIVRHELIALHSGKPQSMFCGESRLLIKYRSMYDSLPIPRHPILPLLFPNHRYRRRKRNRSFVSYNGRGRDICVG